MPYSPPIVANAVLYRAKQRGLFVSHLKLQKLLFFTHAWRLALHNRAAVEERPEAWEYGPIFSTLYHRLKGSGHEPIHDYIATVQAQTNAYAELMPSPGDAGFWRILDQVVDRYGPLNALQLCTMSHQPGGAWDQARKLKQATIPDDIIRSCFREMLK